MQRPASPSTTCIHHGEGTHRNCAVKRGAAPPQDRTGDQRHVSCLSSCRRRPGVADPVTPIVIESMRMLHAATSTSSAFSTQIDPPAPSPSASAVTGLPLLMYVFNAVLSASQWAGTAWNFTRSANLPTGIACGGKTQGPCAYAATGSCKSM